MNNYRYSFIKVLLILSMLDIRYKCYSSYNTYYRSRDTIHDVIDHPIRIHLALTSDNIIHMKHYGKMEQYE